MPSVGVQILLKLKQISIIFPSLKIYNNYTTPCLPGTLRMLTSGWWWRNGTQSFFHCWGPAPTTVLCFLLAGCHKPALPHVNMLRGCQIAQDWALNQLENTVRLLLGSHFISIGLHTTCLWLQPSVLTVQTSLQLFLDPFFDSQWKWTSHR